MSTLSQNIKRATSDFDNIRDAIEQKGVEVPRGTSTAGYAEKILDIETGITPTGKITFTENATDVDITQYALADVAVEGSAEELDNFIAGKTVEVTSNIEVVPDFAFAGKSKLEVVNLPNALYIGKYAFSARPSAQSGSGSSGVSGEDGGETPGEDDSMLFNNKKLRTVNMPNVTNIDNYAFADAENLEITELPDSLMVIGEGAFSGCPKVQLTRFPQSLVRVESFSLPFQETIDIGSLPDTLEYIDSGITYDQITAYLDQFTDGNGNIDLLQVPPKFFNIEFGDNVLRGNNNIFESYSVAVSNVIFPDGTKRIPRQMLSGNLQTVTSITLPDSVIEICDGAFSLNSYGSRGPIQSVYLGTSLVKIGNSAFNDQNQLTAVELPESVQYIGYGAFGQMSKISSLYIPKSVDFIGEEAFSASSEFGSSLNSIEVAPENAKYDSRNNCNAIIEKEDNRLILGCVNTTIPDSVEIIGNSSLSNCNIHSITIPNSVIKIESRAFANNPNLTSIILSNSLKYVGENAFQNTSVVQDYEGFGHVGDVLIYSRGNWSNFPQGIRIIACDSCQYIDFSSYEGEIVLPDTVEYINDSAFSGCSGISSAFLGNSVKEIGSYAFSDVGTSLIKIPATVENIGDYAFNAQGLDQVDLREFTAQDVPSPLRDYNAYSVFGEWRPNYVHFYFSTQEDVDAYSQNEMWQYGYGVCEVWPHE